MSKFFTEINGWKIFIPVFICMVFSNSILSQNAKQTSTKFIAGISGPELLHAGVAFRLSNTNQLGINAGIGPSSGEAWPSVSAEHRFYFGKNDIKSNRKAWFCRQGITFFPSANSSQQIALTLTWWKRFYF
jgi:hypothetical protein